jgi:hypothetical protein
LRTVALVAQPIFLAQLAGARRALLAQLLQQRFDLTLEAAQKALARRGRLELDDGVRGHRGARVSGETGATARHGNGRRHLGRSHRRRLVL